MIINVGDESNSWNPALNKLGAKNLIPFPYLNDTRTVNGVTYTVNEDGSITANGTATANASFSVHGRSKTTGIPLPKGEYIVNGCPAGGSTSTYRIGTNITVNGAGKEVAIDTGNGKTFTLEEDDFKEDNVYLGVYIMVYSGTTVKDLVFKPMVRHASIIDSTYEPYAMTNKELTDSVNEISEAFQDGCDTIVSGITAQGVTPKSNSPADIINAVDTVATNKYNAGVTATKVGTVAPGQVLTGKTFTNSSGVGLTGTMPNRGAVAGSITTSGGSYAIEAGYHNGAGKVTGPTLAQLIGTNATLDGGGKVLEGYTAYGKNGVKYTGNMVNKGGTTQDATPSSDANNIYLPIPASGYYNTSSKLKCKGINHMSFNNGLTAQTGNQTITHSREWTAEMTGRLTISMMYTSFAGVANTQGTCSCTVDGAAQTPTRDSGSGWDRVVVYSMYVTKGQKIVCTGTLPETGNATHSVGQSWNMCYVS